MRGRTKLLLGAAAAAAIVAPAAATSAARRWARAIDPTHGDPLGEPDGHDVVVSTPDGARLSARVAGGADTNAATVVLSHCWTGDRRIWGPVARRLVDAGHRVVVYDQRGHGGSTVGRHGYAISALGADLRAVVEHFDVRNGVVAGHSMGGMSAQAFAIEHPEVLQERVRGLALVATACGGLAPGRVRSRVAASVLGSPTVNAVLASRRFGPVLVRGSVGKTPALSHLEAVRDTFVGTDATTRAEFFTSMATMDLSPGLSRVDVPAVVVCGTRDQLTPPVHARRLAELLPNARLEILPDAGHMLPCEQPDTVAELIRWVASVAPTVPAGATART